jgi:hypothetical protein
VKTVIIEVSGEPAPKGSRTVGRRKNGTIYTRPANPKEKGWQAAVKAACADLKPLDGPYDVEVKFRFQSPQKPKYKYPSRTDIDKLCRSTLDGIVAGGIITDDRHITRLTAQKEYGTEGCVIFVRSLA